MFISMWWTLQRALFTNWRESIRLFVVTSENILKKVIFHSPFTLNPIDMDKSESTVNILFFYIILLKTFFVELFSKNNHLYFREWPQNDKKIHCTFPFLILKICIFPANFIWNSCDFQYFWASIIGPTVQAKW